LVRIESKLPMLLNMAIQSASRSCQPLKKLNRKRCEVLDLNAHNHLNFYYRCKLDYCNNTVYLSLQSCWKMKAQSDRVCNHIKDIMVWLRDFHLISYWKKMITVVAWHHGIQQFF
jgi:hypothetical protein